MRAHRGRIQILVWLAIVLVTLLIAAKTFGSYQLGTHIDDARYIILARSLISSDAFGLINTPGAPQPERYPFGYPLLLSLVMRIVPNPETALIIPSIAATVVNASLLFWGWRLLSGTNSIWWATAIASLYGVAPMTSDLARRVMSEPLFLSFCLAALLLAQYRVGGQRGAWWPLAMSLALTGALFTRSVGVILVVTVVLYLAWRLGRNCWREVALTFGLAAATVGCVLLLTPVRPANLLPREYLNDNNAIVLAAAVDRVSGTSAASIAPAPAQAVAGDGSNGLADVIFRNARFHAVVGIQTTALGIGGGSNEAVLADQLGFPLLPTVLGLLITGLTLLGWAHTFFTRQGTVFVWFALMYLPALILWSGRDARLLYPIGPQLQWGFLLGLAFLANLIGRSLPGFRASRVLPPLLTIVVFGLVLHSFIRSATVDDSRLHAGDLSLRTVWVQTTTQPTDVVMTEAPEVDYLYSDRETVDYPTTVGLPEQFQQYILNHGAAYVLVAPALEWQPIYTPHLSDRASVALQDLQALQRLGLADLVYESETDAVRVFHVHA